MSETSTPPRAIAYVRTAVRDEEHLQRQIAAINGYCEERGIVVAQIMTARLSMRADTVGVAI